MSDPLVALAASIRLITDDPTVTAWDKVAYYCETFPEELPPRFTDADFDRLVDLVSE